MNKVKADLEWTNSFGLDIGKELSELLQEELRKEEEWRDMLKEAKTNPALQSAIDQCIMIYKLSKEYNNGV